MLDQLLDHLVGAAEQRQREGEAERLGGLEIDNELDFCKQLDRQVGGLLPVENAPAIYANKALSFGKARTVSDKTAGQRLFDVRVYIAGTAWRAASARVDPSDLQRKCRRLSNALLLGKALSSGPLSFSAWRGSSG